MNYDIIVLLDRVEITLLNYDEFLIETKLFEKNMVEKIYNSALTVYSVATHCLANSIRNTDIGIAYEFSSALSSLCLNLPTKIFDKLEIPYDFIKNLPDEIQETVSNRASHMISIRDRGFAFFVLSQYAPKIDELGVLDWLENTVKAAGLPSISELEYMAKQEMYSLKNRIIDGPLASRLENLLKIGHENYIKRSIYGKHEPLINSLRLISQEIKLPPILLGDDNIFDLGLAFGKVQYSTNDIENWVLKVWDIESKLREFQRACTF